MPQGNLVEVLGNEVRQGSLGELMVESSPWRQRRPPCKTNKEMSDEAADAAALTHLLTYSCTAPRCAPAQPHAAVMRSPHATTLCRPMLCPCEAPDALMRSPMRRSCTA